MTDRINNFFGSLSLLTDDQIKAKNAELDETDILESAFLQADILNETGLESRRLKVAIGTTMDKLPLTVENIEFLTDAEIQNGFIDAQPSERVAFAKDAMKDPRAARLLKGVQGVIDARKVEAQRLAEEEVARLVAEETVKARKFLLEHPDTIVNDATTVVDDEVAIAYVQKQPNGYFRTAKDLEALFLKGDEGDETPYVRDMLTKKVIPLKDARVIRYCLVTDEEGAKRLVKVLPRRQGKDRDRYYHLDATLEQLQGKDAAKAEQKAAYEAFEQAVRAELTPAATSYEALTAAYLKVIEDNLEGGQNATVPEWKMEVISAIASDLEEGKNGVRYRYVGELRERFPNAEAIPALETFIGELTSAYKEFTGPEKMRAKMFKMVQLATTHLGWLKENPEGVNSGSKDREDRPRREYRGREEQPWGTHFDTKGTREDPRLTKHGDPDEEARARRDKRERDRQHTRDTRGSGSSGNKGKGKGKGK